MTRPLRVIHCGTGTAGGLALGAILDDPGMQLVGLLVHGEGKRGQDAGTLAGRPAVGVLATSDVAQLVALAADCVCYMMLTPDAEHIVAFLESGKRVVTTAGLMHPHSADSALAQRLEAACRRGNSALYATGINPGFVDATLPLTMSQLCRRIDTVTVQEYADCGKYPAPHILSIMGFGRTPEQIAAEGAASLELMCTFFRQSVAALAADLGLPVDAVQETREFVLAERACDIAAGHIAAGTVAGQRWRWSGLVDGRERVVQETYWFTAFDLGPGYPKQGELADDTLWRVTLEGEPSLRCTVEPRVSFADASARGDNPSALATAMAAVNALPAVCAARSGLLGAADLKVRDMPSRLRRDR
jgi:4-hydroxy-tetrahydrodipicolinate reductase